MPKKDLTGFGAGTKKSTTPRKDRQAPEKELGRPTELRDEELLERFKSITWFLQVEWGKIGYQIQRVGSPDEIITLLQLTDNRGSRGEAERIIRCLSTPSCSRASPQAARLTRQELKNAKHRTDLAWSEYHKQGAIFEKCKAAMSSAIAGFGEVAQLWPWFCVLYLFAEVLGIEFAKEAHSQAATNLNVAQGRQREIAAQLLLEEAALAQRELLKFVSNDRYSGDLENFAAAMAGLPELSWISSLRRCSRLQLPTGSPQMNYLVFQFLERIVQGSKSLEPGTLETVCREKILDLECGDSVRHYLGWNWAYLRQAIAQVKGKRISRNQLPHILAASFEDNLMRPKSLAEAELAERDRIAE